MLLLHVPYLVNTSISICFALCCQVLVVYDDPIIRNLILNLTADLLKSPPQLLCDQTGSLLLCTNTSTSSLEHFSKKILSNTFELNTRFLQNWNCRTDFEPRLCAAWNTSGNPNPIF